MGRKEGRRKEERGWPATGRSGGSCNTRYVSWRGVVGACAPGRVTRERLLSFVSAASCVFVNGRQRSGAWHACRFPHHSRQAHPARSTVPGPHTRSSARDITGSAPNPARKTGTLWASAPFYIYIYVFDVIIISLSRNSTSVFRYSEQMEGEDFEIRETYNFWKHFLNKDFVENKR